MSGRYEEVKSSRRIDWNVFTNFKSRRTSEDLERLCKGLSRTQLQEIFSSPDDTGLLPIHWAAIHNRSDLIGFMLHNGASRRSKCANRLFADGTPLHLAAMHGSIEAAAVMLRSSSSNSADSSRLLEMLTAKDADGQTALMRSAAPRTKRHDIARDLLGKNLWSVSARPAEMALFLMSKGADWRATDPNGLNLMHLSIINDHGDIVHMLLVIDKSTLTIRTKFSSTSASDVQREPSSPVISTDYPTANKEFKTITLESPVSSTSTSSASSATSQSSYKPLLSDTEYTDQLASSGLTPLQLAILYGRLSVIRLLWYAEENSPNSDDDMELKSSSSRRLNSTLMRAAWSNKSEAFRLARRTAMKFALVVDLIILMILIQPNRINGAPFGPYVMFLICYSLATAFAFRTMIRNPGYQRRSSVQYLSELRSLVIHSGMRIDSNEHRPESPNSATTYIPKLTRTDRNASLEERVRLLCHKCRCIRRPRSRHCNYCNHCVQDFDHHCIYLGCCIGRKNRVDFLMMNIAIALMGICGAFMRSDMLNRDNMRNANSFIATVWLLKYVLIGGIGAFCVLRRASHGLTMYEEIRSKQISAIFGPNGPPPKIELTHKAYATQSGSYWRFVSSHERLDTKQIVMNLREFANYNSLADYFTSIVCNDTPLTRTITRSDSRIDISQLA